MLNKRSIMRTQFRKYFVLSALTTAALLVGTPVWSDDDSRGRKGNEAGDDRAIRLLEVIPVPASADNNTAGGLYSFDISWVDQASETYYLADRSNKRVDIVNAKTGTFLTAINASPPFAGISPPAFSTSAA